jgi:hypothetical protein
VLLVYMSYPEHIDINYALFKPDSGIIETRSPEDRTAVYMLNAVTYKPQPVPGQGCSRPWPSSQRHFDPFTSPTEATPFRCLMQGSPPSLLEGGS